MSTTQQFISSFEKPVNLTQNRFGRSTLRLLRECFFDLPGMKRTHMLFTAVVLLLLVIPASGYLAAKLLDQAGDNLSRATTISMFIEARPTSDLQGFTQRLAEYEQIEIAKLVTMPLEKNTSQRNSTQLVEVIPVTGLPVNAFSQLTDQLATLAGVELISWDRTTLNRNQLVSTQAHAIATATYLAALIIFVSTMWVFILRHVHLSKRTIDLKLNLGATPAQISTPLIIRGCVCGIVVGAIAFSFAKVFSLGLSHMIDVTIFDIDLSMQPQEILFCLAIVFMLSFAISRLALRKELSD